MRGVGGGSWLVAEGVFILEQAANVERVAVAAAGGSQPAFHRLSAFDERLDLRELALCEVAYSLVGCASLALGGQERSGVVKAEAGALGDVDDTEAP